MNRQTIDFGIDLGTTNSEIACMENGEVRVFKNYKREEFTPSVVRIDEKGTVRVGRKAYERLIDDPDNTVEEFKRWMGTQQVKKFVLSNKKLSPEELSAEILKDLKITAKKNLPEEDEISCAVITVPCNFEIVQCEATQRAAKIAGIKYAPLLQEPIAASIAYGFLEKMPKGYWIVFDLGGGTFDVAIMSAKEGRLSVVDHFGDNHLGGKDFDWKIVENIIHPVLSNEYNLPGLGRTKEYQILNARLKSAAEDAKIQLSQSEEADIVVYSDRYKDNNGKVIDIVIPLKRSEFIPLIECYIDKTIQLFSTVLENQGLSPTDISQLILVGGPTQIPYVRKRLKDAFGIPIECKIDPIIVVAQGAAIFAASQLIPDELTKRDYSKVSVKLAYNPMTTEIDPAVGGRFFASKEEEKLPEGMRVQINRTGGDWESGMIEIKDNAFFANVNLRENKVNNFTLALFDKTGNKVPIEPDSFTITQGISVAEPPLIRSIGVELENGALSKHLTKSESLPARSKPFSYFTTRTVRPGENEDVLKIHLWEGESDIADRNRHLGTLQIKGADVTRTLPENSEVEIIISVDQSRAVSAEAFIPLLDKKISGIVTQKISPKLEPGHIAADLNGEEKRLNKLKQEIMQANDKTIENKLSESYISEGIKEIRTDIQAAEGGDPDAVEKADRNLKELKQKLDSIEKLAKWPVALKEYNEIVSDCEEITASYGNNDDKDQLYSLKKEAEKSIGSKDINRIKKIAEEIINIRWAVLFRQPGFWVSAFQEVKKDPGNFTDKNRAEELIDEGSAALQRQDLDSLKSIMFELWSLMPRDEQEKISERVSDAGIRKI
ncbi:MAG: Hsp70 family protein [Candidatus Omnitrophica bacterium]|nr:Hsp70 family protein [Candidatus Omnitrophota bacterium]